MMGQDKFNKFFSAISQQITKIIPKKIKSFMEFLMVLHQNY